ncbi:MAG: hypothetical protein PHP50_08950 [Lachnospiraceae bacterium]|nr:hypothetical protein [Lachnospiraceae bacterium]
MDNQENKDNQTLEPENIAVEPESTTSAPENVAVEPESTTSAPENAADESQKVVPETNLYSTAHLQQSDVKPNKGAYAVLCVLFILIAALVVTGICIVLRLGSGMKANMSSFLSAVQSGMEEIANDSHDEYAEITEENEAGENDADEYEAGETIEDWFSDSLTTEEILALGDIYDEGPLEANAADFDLQAPYCEELENYVRDDLSYQVSNRFFVYYSEDGRAAIEIEYPYLTGDIENIESINNDLAGEAAFYVQNFEASVKDYLSEDEEYSVWVEPYIANMSEETISIVFNEYVQEGDTYSYVSLCPMTYDLTTGEFAYVSEQVRMDDAFIKAFRAQCETQGMGDNIADLSDTELADMFSESYGDMVAFYTPLGLEVGFNYDAGWMTVTMREYEQYMETEE